MLVIANPTLANYRILLDVNQFNNEKSQFLQGTIDMWLTIDLGTKIYFHDSNGKKKT